MPHIFLSSGNRAEVMFRCNPDPKTVTTTTTYHLTTSVYKNGVRWSPFETAPGSFYDVGWLEQPIIMKFIVTRNAYASNWVRRRGGAARPGRGAPQCRRLVMLVDVGTLQ